MKKYTNKTRFLKRIVLADKDGSQKTIFLRSRQAVESKNEAIFVEKGVKVSDAPAQKRAKQTASADTSEDKE